jgi:amino acid transporter
MALPVPQPLTREATAAREAAIPAPRPALGLVDAIALIVGTVVGAGIFRTPSLVAANAGSETMMLLAWVVGGVVSLMGALCYAELAATYPHPGGDYHYLGRALGQRLAFLFAWARITVIQTGSIALLAFVFADYAAPYLPLGAAWSPAYAALAVVVLTALNVAGVRQGKNTQNVLTAVEVLGLVAVVTVGLLLPASPAPAAAPAPPAASAIGLVMVFVLLTYGGWNEAAYISAEMRRGRDIVRALVWSLLLVTALYVLVNAAYLRGLGLAGVAESRAVGADLVERALGPGSGRLVAMLIAVAAMSSANAAIFTGARTAYALGRDVRAFAFLGRWHPGTQTPVSALLTQGAVAVILVVLGGLTRKGFETMVEYTAPVFWLFFTLTGVALFVLRRKEPSIQRPFRVPLYPLTPLLFCASSTFLLYSSLAYTGIGALVGVAVLGAGAVVLVVSGPRLAKGEP